MSTPENFEQTMKDLQVAITEEANSYEKILEWSKEQSELIEKGEIQALFPVFTRITEEMIIVEELEEKIKDAKQLWETHRESVEPELKANIEKAIDKVSALLKEIIDLENSQQDNISKQKLKTTSSLTKIQKGQQLNKAYGSSAQPKSILDQKS